MNLIFSWFLNRRPRKRNALKSNYKWYNSSYLRIVLQKHGFVDAASALNTHFTDSGLFGITIEGSSSHSRELIDVALKELHGLTQPIGAEELNKAKNILKMNILLTLERQGDRLEEIAKNYLTFGTLTFHQYCDIIDGVTSEQINRAAAKLLSGKPSLVISGSSINQVPSLAEVQSQLR